MSAAPSTVAVKLGGSLLTDKTRHATLRGDVLRRLCSEIAQAREEMTSGLIVAHGSGSFGHVAAKKHGFADAGSVSAFGISETQREARRLHERVVDSLREAGVACFSFPPGSALVADAGRPVHMEAEPVRLALEQNLVTVTCGDVVLDRSNGACIASTEVVLTAIVGGLSGAFGVRRILWLGDTDGVWQEGETVSRIDESNIQDLVDAAGGAAGTDVTGGMRLRLQTVWKLAKVGIESQLLNGLEEGVLYRALLGREHSGTWVRSHKSS